MVAKDTVSPPGKSIKKLVPRAFCS